MATAKNLVMYLKFWAEFDPKGSAIASVAGELTHRQLFRLVRRVAAKLFDEGIRPGHVVYVNLPQMQDVVVFLALHSIGAKCAYHFTGYQEALPVGGDFWIKTLDRPDADGAKNISLSAEWWAGAEKFDPYDLNETYLWESDEISYFMYTSGTTGSFKCIGLPYDQLVSYDSKTTSPWSQSGLKFSLFGWAGGFSQFLTTLIIQGKPVLVNNSPSEVQKLFQKAKPDTVYGSPALISAFIDAAILNGTDLTSTKQVVNMGGQISPALFVKIKQNFTGAKVINLYGSSEGGRIASKQLLNANDGKVAGSILPEATVEIVDSHGKQVPRGATGLIRYKSLTQHYVNDSEATSLVFKNGWFYCGDLGHFDQDNNLILEGRESEVLNIGGEKLDPLVIDQFVLFQPGVVDCGTFSINTAAGRHATGIAVVVQSDFDAKSLRTSVLAKFPNAAPLAIVKAEQIPKTQMGKIMRKALASQFQEIAAKADTE